MNKKWPILVFLVATASFFIGASSPWFQARAQETTPTPTPTTTTTTTPTPVPLDTSPLDWATATDIGAMPVPAQVAAVTGSGLPFPAMGTPSVTTTSKFVFLVFDEITGEKNTDGTPRYGHYEVRADQIVHLESTVVAYPEEQDCTTLYVMDGEMADMRVVRGSPQLVGAAICIATKTKRFKISFAPVAK